MTQNLVCPNCGTQNRSTARFCSNCAAPLTSGTGMLPPNSILQNRYLVIKRLARGGMGAVYQATDERFHGKLWAIKEMSDAGVDPSERQRAVQDFQREADILAALDHPNLVRVVDIFQENARWYLVMDFIEGETLEEKLASSPGPLPPDQVLDWSMQLCDVLAYLHGLNPPIIFRDLKPSNIMLERGTHCVKLIDFGIARLFKSGQVRDTSLLGTAGYAPPEQHGKGQTDARSDIYSLGVTMHQLLTRYDPAASPFNLPAPRSLNPAISEPLEQVIVTATQLDRGKRYRSAVLMRQALIPLTPTRSTSAVPPPLVTSSAVVTSTSVSLASRPRPLALTLLSVFCSVSGIASIWVFGFGAIGIGVGIGMWLRETWAREVAILYILGGTLLGGGMEAYSLATAAHQAYYGSGGNRIYYTSVDWTLVAVALLSAFIVTVGFFALLAMFRGDILDYLYPERGPHLSWVGRSADLVAWVQVLFGCWALLPLILGIGMLHRKRWALYGSCIFLTAGAFFSMLVFWGGLATLQYYSWGLVLLGHLLLLLNTASLILITRDQVAALF